MSSRTGSEAQVTPSRGAFRDGVYVFPVRVYFEDTDAVGIVYYANYFKFAERARSELMRDIGADYVETLAANGGAFAVRQCSADYLRPARLDDLLEVETRLIEVKGASVRAEQTVCRDGVDLVRLKLRLAVISESGRPLRLPTGLRATVEDLCDGKVLKDLCNGNGRRD
jgi:acyl-CoA thioester hydrolase